MGGRDAATNYRMEWNHEPNSRVSDSESTGPRGKDPGFAGRGAAKHRTSLSRYYPPFSRCVRSSNEQRTECTRIIREQQQQ